MKVEKPCRPDDGEADGETLDVWWQNFAPTGKQRMDWRLGGGVPGSPLHPGLGHKTT